MAGFIRPFDWQPHERGHYEQKQEMKKGASNVPNIWQSRTARGKSTIPLMSPEAPRASQNPKGIPLCRIRRANGGSFRCVGDVFSKSFGTMDLRTVSK